MEIETVASLPVTWVPHNFRSMNVGFDSQTTGCWKSCSQQALRYLLHSLLSKNQNDGSS